MNLRRLHRYLGLALAAPLVLWTATGLLFTWRPGWRGAYEQLQAFQPAEIRSDQLLPLPKAIAAGRAALEQPAAIHRIELGVTAAGPLYRLRFAPSAEPATVLVDARSGKVRSPLALDEVLMIVADATGRATASFRYGSALETRIEGDLVVIRFEGGTVVSVDRTTLALSQRGEDTDRIDALYRLHYLQWTGIKWLDRMVVLAAIGATWVLVVLGLYLMRKEHALPNRLAREDSPSARNA